MTVLPPITGAPATGTPQPPAPETGQPPTPAPPTQPTPPPAPAAATPPAQPPETGDRPNDIAAMEAALAKANAEAASLRHKVKDLEPLANAAREAEEAAKPELQRLTEANAQLETRAASAESELAQLKAAMAAAPLGTPLDQVVNLAGRLRGETPEALATDAEQLFRTFVPQAAAAPPPTAPATAQPGTPVEALTPGAMPTQPAATLADEIRAAETAGDVVKAMELKSQQAMQARKP